MTKKDYLRLLNNGGTSAIELLNQTQPLFNAYRDIELAEKEICSATRQKTDSLLPQDFRRLKNDLGPDPYELTRVERYYSLLCRCKQQFSQMK